MNKVGRWNVLDKFVARDKKGRSRGYYRCVCACGVRRNVLARAIDIGSSKSCGCLAKELSHTPRPCRSAGMGVSAKRSLLSAYQRGAQKRNISWMLEDNHFYFLTKQKCHYCGALPSGIRKSFGNYGNYIYNGIDRVDNKKGYNNDNVVSCCKLCNKTKAGLDVGQFLSLANKISRNVTRQAPRYIIDFDDDNVMISMRVLATNVS